MRIRALTLVVTAGLIASGCISYSSHRGYPPPPPPPPQPVRADPVPQVVYVPVQEGQTVDHARSADLQARFAAAQNISSFVEKDAAMSTIATHAAAAGDVELTKRALDEISSFVARDDASASAALTLSNLGRRAEALEIANSISAFTKRDQTLAKLATR